MKGFPGRRLRGAGVAFGVACPVVLTAGLAATKRGNRGGGDVCGFPYGRDQYAVTLAYLAAATAASLVGLGVEETPSMSLQRDVVRVDASDLCVSISRTRAEMINGPRRSRID